MEHRKVAAVVAALGSLALAGPAAAQQPTIQPGSSIEADGAYCTLAWILDGPDGSTYAATAAHCLGPEGQEVNLASGALMSPIERIGTVAFRGDENVPGRDYAFILIDAEDLAQVDPALKGWPQIPQGMSTSQTAQAGDVIQFSGHGVGFSLTEPTQEERKGILNNPGDDNGEHTVIGPVISGDSGGPVADVTDGNKALGIVNTVGIGIDTGGLVPTHAGEGGVNLEHALIDAAGHGFPLLTLRTVSG